MRIGIFADTHDHLDNIRLAVEQFNRHQCQSVLFAGDLVSTFAVPPLRKLNCPMIACFGDNEGNKLGLRGGMSIVGSVEEPPVYYEADDGTRFVIAHMASQLRDLDQPFDIAVYGHTHKPRLHTDDQQRLWINPGETSGWTFRSPTIAILQTETREVEWIKLNECAV